MFRPASRALLRAPAVATPRGPASRRLISTTATKTKSRSWKSTFARVGLAAGAVYYYNTSSVFAENPTLSFRSKPTPKPETENSLPTLDSVKPKPRDEKPSAPAEPTPESTSAAAKSDATLGAAEELEEEAGQQAAFNPETGEINWDCPCLGGMAHGPCGEDFKAAFSCFIYSEEEPKGIECIDKFKAMQDCFRLYPDIYGAEIDDDEETDAVNTESERPSATQLDESTSPDEKREHAKEARDQVKSATAEKGELAESDEVVPKAWHESETEKKPEQQTEK
ncbi:hypothetical protein BDW59DRAFT_146364 [Aspergillus cavernicola]|uniref:Mitochondrial intermembrane space import and assembly protein 40 n=1 Tax=Aspergillus cavernicola TaxID=176166 RepID=A0ABR4IC30_9EURO